jgi:predicted DNA-binding transcriptional regulator AlpA
LQGQIENTTGLSPPEEANRLKENGSLSNTTTQVASHNTQLHKLAAEDIRMQLLDRKATCALLGGSRPIQPATLYRGIEAGRFPKPINVGPNIVRWLRSECEAALEALIAKRDRA